MEHISDQTESYLQPVWTQVSADCVVDAKKQSPFELVCDCGEVSAMIRMIRKLQHDPCCNER